MLLLTLSLWAAMVYSQEDMVLVLGSGGCKGLAHVGVIEELEKLGLPPNKIVGTSAGALVAALYAQKQDVQKVKKYLIDLKFQDLLSTSLFADQAISKRSNLEAFIDKHIKITEFSELPIDLVIVATNIDTGQAKYFSKGDVKKALLASVSIPGIYQPYKIHKTRYVDGGLSDPLPIGYAKSLNKGKVIASDIACALDSFKDKSLFDVLEKSFEVIYQNLSYREKDKADVLLQMQFRDIKHPFDNKQNKKIYKRGKAVVIENTEQIRKVFSISD